MPLANSAKSNKVTVYHLNIGQPDIKMPEIVWETLKDLKKQVLEYSPSDGYIWLKEKVAKYYKIFLNGF